MSLTALFVHLNLVLPDHVIFHEKNFAQARMTLLHWMPILVQSVTILERSPEFGLWPSWIARGFPGRGFPTREFFTQSLRSADRHVGLCVRYPLFLFDFDQKRNMSTNFSKIPPYQISWKSVQPFSSCYVGTDGRTDGLSCFTRCSKMCALSA
jgi:hypothetical protein